MRSRLALVALAGITLAGVLVLVAAGSTDSSPSGGITVSGSGAATTVPNRAAFSFGVTSQAPTATAALSKVSDAIAKVIASLRAHGIAEADIQTQTTLLTAIVQVRVTLAQTTEARARRLLQQVRREYEWVPEPMFRAFEEAFRGGGPYVRRQQPLFELKSQLRVDRAPDAEHRTELALELLPEALGHVLGAVGRRGLHGGSAARLRPDLHVCVSRQCDRDLEG